MTPREELENILSQSNIERALREQEETLFSLIPELRAEKGFDQKNPWHCYDVWEHTIHAVANSDSNVENRLILLLHDIGKPLSCQEDGEVRHFHGHAEKSAEIAGSVLRRLGYAAEEREEICFFIARHATTITADMVTKENIRIYRRLLLIRFCDGKAYAPAYAKHITDKLSRIHEMLDRF